MKRTLFLVELCLVLGSFGIHAYEQINAQHGAKTSEIVFRNLGTNELVGDIGESGEVSGQSGQQGASTVIWITRLQDAYQKGSKGRQVHIISDDVINALTSTVENRAFIASTISDIEKIYNLVRIMEKAVNPQRGKNLEDLLLTATKLGYIPVVTYLIEHGVDLNKTDCFGRTPLYLACKKGFLPIIKVLLAHGADANRADNNGWTPLHKLCTGDYAIEGEVYLSVIETLIERGAEIDKANDDGQTPLHIASSKGVLPVVTILMEHGADTNKADCCARVPLSVPYEKGHHSIAEALMARRSTTGEERRDVEALLNIPRELQGCGAIPDRICEEEEFLRYYDGRYYCRAYSHNWQRLGQ